MLIEKYTSVWVEQFNQIKKELDISLDGLNYQIEHVGSTSVPGLAAKPIIDVDIIYEGSDEFAAIKTRLENIGYYHNGNQGIVDREVFKRSGQIQITTLDEIRHHLYVCLSTSEALHRHILTRNHFRRNAVARLGYEKMKYHLAEKAGQNKKLYAELKEIKVNDFLDLVVDAEVRNSNTDSL